MNDHSDVLFTTVSSLTGGLVTDLQTAMIAMLVISFIMFGFDRLKNLLTESINQAKHNQTNENKTKDTSESSSSSNVTRRAVR